MNDTWTPTHEYTKLQPNFDGVDPDDAFSKIPYEKGARRNSHHTTAYTPQHSTTRFSRLTQATHTQLTLHNATPPQHTTRDNITL